MAIRNSLPPSRDSTPAYSDNVEGTPIMSRTSYTSGSAEVDFTDEGNWEDEPDYNLANPHTRFPPHLVSNSRSARKRKPAGRKIFIAQPNSARRSFTPKGKGSFSDDAPPLVNLNKEQLRDALNHGAYHSTAYALDVLKTTLWLLRKPLAAILFVYVLAYLLAITSNAFRAVITPICWIPGISGTPLCYTPPMLPNVPRWADYPKLAEMQGATFEQLLDESVRGSGLSLEIKKAEMATKDLIVLVKNSGLKGRNVLAEHLERFVEETQKTGRGLQRFNARVNGAVDSIIAVNDYARTTIEEHGKSKSILGKLNPFSFAFMGQDIVVRTFTDAMSVHITQVQRIIVDAEVNMMNLDRLDEMLITLHDMVSRENGNISAAKDELLAELWTILGGNKRKLRGMEGHLYLLRHIGEYRTHAMAHVVAAVQTLTAMSEDMEDLRERVSAPELIGAKIPAEVHIKAISASVERLQTGRASAQKREEEMYKKITGMVDDD